ncbi:MAG: vitamin K epoxide reductase family protein [bacterium]|nr:vitamin K epoxide reductase family protein [bacterium]
MFTPLVLLLFSLLGMLDAAYLSYTHVFGSAACGAGSGCGAVLTSDYASVCGVPLSVLGLGFYAATMLLAWRAVERDASVRGISLLALVGSLPTLFLIYVQAAIVHAWCPFCLVSAGLMFGILIVSWTDRVRRGSLRPFFGAMPTVREGIPVVLALVLPVFVFVPLQAGVNRVVLDAKTPPVEIVAHIGEREISLTEMDAGIRLRLQKVKDEYRAEWLDRQVLETEAQERGMDMRDLVRQDVHSTIQISQEEVDRRWEEIKGRLAPHTTKASVEGNIRNELGRRKSESALRAYIAKLREKYGTEFHSPASEKILTDANANGGPELGSADAPVTVVVFSDLECNYCARAHRAVEALAKRRPDDVRIVFRHFPVEHLHKHARYAAEMAASVQEQGKFWELVDVLFVNQRNLTPSDVRRLAEEAGVDMAVLDAHLAEGQRIVAADIAAGKALGITSTPTFFINGHYVGSLPVGDGLDKLVDGALKAAGR